MRLEFSKNFRKRLRKLPPDIQDQFHERLRRFAVDKFERALNNHSVDAAFPDCRSINVTGDYRAIFYEEGDTVTFTKIGTHAQLYS